MTRFVADDAELILGVIEANVPLQHVALVSGVSNLFAIGAREGSCPDATGRGVACSLTMAQPSPSHEDVIGFVHARK